MSASNRNLVDDALRILAAIGVPIEDMSSRRREKMAKAFLAVAGLKKGSDWTNVIYDDPEHRLRSRDIIRWMNDHFDEQISFGSYDDIRRKDLVYPVEVGIVLRAAGKDDAATNDGTRGYAINPEFSQLLSSFDTDQWSDRLVQFMKDRVSLAEQLKQKRKLAMLPVNIDGMLVEFGPGEHNEIQKAIIEEFLPRFGFGARVLYVGDTSDKDLVLVKGELDSLGFFELSHDKLPDVVAYSREKNWLFLFEAVHSANPIDPMRKRTLEDLTKNCTADIIFVTAFLNRAVFRKFVADIAWETEVWIAEAPDHMVHFNGDKFLGPHRAHK